MRTLYFAAVVTSFFFSFFLFYSQLSEIGYVLLPHIIKIIIIPSIQPLSHGNDITQHRQTVTQDSITE